MASDDNQPSSAADPFDLQRFLYAQEGPYKIALRELRAGKKTSHWMWFIFPQLAGLGTSPMAERFAIQSRDEAAAYLAHKTLGARLHACAAALLTHENKSAREIMGEPDDLKLHSSATLFAQVSPPDSPFHQLLTRYFDSEPDPRTLELLQRETTVH
ncbi:DUF1810 domain-containing protein [Actomonas aquatica]|uniref:DUF1810 domain-containing protein n=1 Tax=Actomonas aquatica TaxID=2866162 RepID=A0ABZ1C411_9BACT|nr:DUF1810 domain-containing protein [Opitutus sp. WL0086]WRQ86441.1 DUF1810 domain-containing protein [Opitutus sp. WL0086]